MKLSKPEMRGQVEAGLAFVLIKVSDQSGVLAEQLFDCYCRAIAKVKMDNLRGMTVQNAPFAEVRIF